MPILITGATGYIGNKLAHKLAGEGKKVHAFVRTDAANTLLQHPNIILFQGNLLSLQDVKKAMQGCDQVYHLAAKVGAWTNDPTSFYSVNVEGTRTVLECALQCGVARTVFTSTCGVLGPTDNGPLDENSIRSLDYALDYDCSKKLAEDLVLQYAEKGLHTVIVSPSKVYGPGHTSHALTANAIIDTFLKRGYTFVPAPGTFPICLAFVDDVVKGHILAMEKGQAGNRYILGGFNITYLDFFRRIRMLAHRNSKIIPLSKTAVKAFAYLQQAFFQLTAQPARLTPKQVSTLR